MNSHKERSRIMRYGVVSCCAVLLVSVLVAGCGGGNRAKTVAVTGNLTLDGKPVNEARIRFSPSGSNTTGRTAIGDTDASGNFKLSTFEPGDGIIPGEYDADVIISKVVTQPIVTGDIAAKVAAEAPQEGDIPAKYLDVKTSGLHYTFADQDSGRVVEVKLTK
jgi:hypothetical protein